MENIVVKEIIPNKDKTIIDIKLENGNVIKAFETYSTYFRDKFTYNVYTLGGVFKQYEVSKLRDELKKKDIMCNSLEDCLKENRIDTAIKEIEGVSLDEYVTETKENEKTYTYPDLDRIIEQEKNKRLQEKYGKTKELIGFFNNMAQQNGTQVGKK